MATVDREVTDGEERDERERGEQEGKMEGKKELKHTPKKCTWENRKRKGKIILGRTSFFLSGAGLSVWSHSEPALSDRSTHEHQTCPRTHSPATLQSRAPGGSHY